MPRRRERNPYQLPLELGRPAHEPTSVYRALLEDLATPQETSRFVRMVPEEVVVHSAADAAAHLYTVGAARPGGALGAALPGYTG